MPAPFKPSIAFMYALSALNPSLSELVKSKIGGICIKLKPPINAELIVELINPYNVSQFVKSNSNILVNSAINELIINNIYGDDISAYLTNIMNILNGMINNNNNNLNNLATIKNALKMYIIRILNFNNGYDILRQLICEDI